MQERGTQAVETPYQLYSAASLVRLRTAVAAIPMPATARFHARRELQASVSRRASGSCRQLTARDLATVGKWWRAGPWLVMGGLLLRFAGGDR